MKKLIALILCLVMSLSVFTGCTQKDAPKDDPQEVPKEEPQEDPKEEPEDPKEESPEEPQEEEERKDAENPSESKQMSILFFDDTRLYLRKNLTREYGTPEYVETLTFSNSDWVYTWPLGQWQENNTWYMPVLVRNHSGERYIVVMLKSADGEHWQNDNRAKEMGYFNPVSENLCFLPGDHQEPAYIYYDENDVAERRYKMLVAEIDNGAHWVNDIVFYSADGFRWKRMEDVLWSYRGAEPGTGIFYIEEKQTTAIVLRPTWGDRRVCLSLTKDFETFTEPEIKVMPDSLDEAQTEFYGMRVNEYKGYYIGFLWRYHTIESHQNKYSGGKLDCELAYSINGTTWFRSLRTAFISNSSAATAAGMVFPSEIARVADGSLRITAGANPNQHPYYQNGGTLVQYKLREDGFVKLTAGKSLAELCTRPVVLTDGTLDINIKCTSPASVAIYDYNGNKAIPGFDFTDCINFTGDSTHWAPQWKNADISSLKGQAVCIYIKFRNGELYAINGNLVPITYHEATRYMTKGQWLDPSGF